jgi:hypothetical protein
VAVRESTGGAAARRSTGGAQDGWLWRCVGQQRSRETVARGRETVVHGSAAWSQDGGARDGAAAQGSERGAATAVEKTWRRCRTR